MRLAKTAGVQEITYYGFTTDNCGRPPEQVRAFSQACVDAVKLIAGEGVSLLVVGDRDAPAFPRELLPYTTRTDLNGGGIRVNFLVNYGWEWDLAQLSAPGTRRDKIPRHLPRRAADSLGRDAPSVRLFAGAVRLRRFLRSGPAVA